MGLSLKSIGKKLDQVGTGLVNTVQSVAAAPANEVRLAAANLTNNQVAANNARQALAPVADAAHAVTRIVPEAITSLDPSIHTAYHPNSPMESWLFGSTPVQNIETKVAQNYDAHSNLPTWERTSLAGLEGAGSIIQDFPAFKAGSTAISAGINTDRAARVASLANGATDEAGFAKVPSAADQPVVSPADEPLPSTPVKPVVTPKGTKPQLAPEAVNLDRNPHTSPIEPVEAGDYQAARAMPQAVTKPIEFVRDRWTYAMHQLAKANPDEYNNYWRHVENLPQDASPELKQAVNLWRQGANRVHASSVAVGKNTNYLKDYALHPWKLADVSEEDLANGNPLKSHQMNRKYQTIAEGEANGMQLGQDPLSEGLNYFNGSSRALHKAVSKKALEEADAAEAKKAGTLDLGGSQSVSLSAKGMHAGQGLANYVPSGNRVLKALRSTNVGVKSTLLSLGQFHPINISMLRAAPTLAMEGHPLAAIKGVARTFRPLLPGGHAYAERVLNRALNDGMVDKAAQIGMPYGEAGYNAAGSSLKSGVGHTMIFERQMPMMHDQMVRSIVKDLEDEKVPLNSQAARDAGLAGNMIMGFLNKELQNISPRVRQAMSDYLLAGQFTPSKFGTMKYAVSKGGVAGSYARRATVANVAAATAAIVAGGIILHQKSDNLRDMMLRAVFDPAVPTPMKDAKGNNIKLRLPGTDTSDMAKLLGMKLVRGQDGHLTISWNPHNMPQTIEDFARARLSPIPSAVAKVATNSTYSGKPLFDPNAPLTDKVAQAGTSIVGGDLPIGAQGLQYTKFVKDHVPESIREVLDAQTPGTNPVVKSIGSSFGATPSTDMTVGKGAQDQAYFDSVANFGRGLNRQEKAAFDLWTASKKNPVTGAYDVKPSVYDAKTKASALLENPKALDNLIKMNQSLAKKGQSVDPLWLQSPDKIKAYLTYSTMDLGGPQRGAWYDQNKDWYSGLTDARNTFFNSLPKGDPNKPKLDLQYPEASPQVSDLMNQYSTLTDSKAKGQFLDAHPEVVAQWDKQTQYTNDFLKEMGYSPMKGFPETDAKLSAFMSKYNAADKATRKSIRNSDPASYKAMVGYYDNLDLYNLGKEAGKNALVGEPDVSQKEMKAISGLSRDVTKNANGSYSLNPAGWMSGSGSGSGSSSGRSYSSGSGGVRHSRGEYRSMNARAYTVAPDGANYVNKPANVKFRKANAPHKVTPKPKPTAKFSSAQLSKPKVTMKKIKV